MAKVKDITGNRYGRLVAVSIDHKNKRVVLIYGFQKACLIIFNSTAFIFHKNSSVFKNICRGIKAYYKKT